MTSAKYLIIDLVFIWRRFRDIKAFLTDRDALSTVGESLGVKDLVLTQVH